jgi:type IV secretory pathway TrbL component
MNEFYSHTTSVICLFILLALPLLFETGMLWVIGVILINLKMFIRATFGEISGKYVWLFIMMNVVVMILTMIFSIYQSNI